MLSDESIQNFDGASLRFVFCDISKSFRTELTPSQLL